jgi:hypothetical protein
VREQIEAAINSTLITPSVKHIQEKVENIAERLILSSALAKQKVYDLSLAAQEQEKREHKDNRKIV